ncbi:paraquat-inducible protein A [Nitrospira lenta]|uniref:Paraquat-inducible protein A n=1 Tax=Nitrospira lenta TaxID=1436998 RepID=A0A330L2D7_9BACT|nr:paraquat-inducible protein A [Nitrospira lenta]SPP63012.1 Paraquat-inducible protein A [Nitrospira lenta]
MAPLSLIACHECDLLQRRIVLPQGGVGRCRRCHSVLYRTRQGGVDQPLACAIAASILFLIANVYPIVGLEVQGERQAANLYDTVHMLWVEGRGEVAILVCLTALIMPAIEIALLIYLLLPLKLHCVTEGTLPVLRFLQAVHPWSMVEVFLLGILVAFVKLEHLAEVRVGIALWAYVGLIPLLIVASLSFDPEALWSDMHE